MTILKRLSQIVIMMCLALVIFACQKTTTEGETTMTQEETSQTTTEELTTTTTEEQTTTQAATTTEEVIPVVFETVSVVTESPTVDQLLEIDLQEPDDKVIEANYNPYDYSEIEVRFTFTKPNQETLTQFAFWYRDYEEVSVIGEQRDQDGFITAGQEYLDWGSDSQSHYRVRINPDEAGLWQYQMDVFVKGVKTQTLNNEFTVEETTVTPDGYIEVDPVNNRNFIFSESQRTYIPTGLNLAWWSTTLGAHDYYNWFKKLHEVDGNMARIWLSNWSFSLHKFSYTNFDSRQNILARLDYLFGVADEFDINIMLTLINHGQFSANTNPEWAENPYNEANGGMLKYPIQFFYNEEAIAAYKNELRYLMARFGYTEHIFAWELFNEVDWIDGYSGPIVAKWHDEMAQFIHQYDPYHHLVTTSYKYTFGTPAFQYESLDFATFHSYEYYDKVYYTKLIDEMTSLWDTYQKPVMFGEIGIDWQAGSSTYSSDYTGVTIRQGTWGGILTSSGSANQWWWDSWIDRYDLWDCYLGANVYATYIDVANKAYSLLQESATDLVTGDNHIQIMGYLLEDAIYGYLYNTSWNYWNKEPNTYTNISIQIPIENGTYQLMIFDTETGAILEQRQVEVQNNSFSLEGLSITTDYAFILK